MFRIARGLLCALLPLTLIACNIESTLVPLEHFIASVVPPQKLVNVSFCTDPAVQAKFAVKTLIIFDHSGSNKQNYLMNEDGTGTPKITNGNVTISRNYATDPTGQLRYGDITTPGTLLHFLSTTPANDPLNPSKYFAVIDFSDAATTYPPNNSGFTSDVADFYDHISTAATSASLNGVGVPMDNGATSYLSALTSAYNIINFDVQKAKVCALRPRTTAPSTDCPSPGVPVASSYVIVFISDGAPIVDISGIGLDANGNVIVTGAISITREPTNEILGSVQSIIGLNSNTKYVAGINLFSIFYFNPTNNLDRSAQTLLAQMAKVGNGISYSAVSGSKLDYTRFVPAAKLIKYTLSDIFVTNSSVTWGADGTLKKDSDADGLSDEQEAAFGTSSTDPDSDGNGVSDLVEYQVARGARSSTTINYASGLCSGVASRMVNGKRIFNSSDPNGLNDCEKIVLSDTGGINNPDSNGDSVPDWLEFKNGVPFQLGAVPASTGSSSDGYTPYDKIKFSLPTNLQLSQVRNLVPARYRLTEISNTSIKNCYNLDVTDLPMIGTDNRIRIDVVEKSELLQDKYLYRVAEKPFSGSSMTLHFNDWSDPAEVAAGTWKAWP
ncbi:MAG: hypothetical protein H7333_08135 [Bdellovibrionales bacterium]|nr:hypothetical protein [Oligoflexia bacterium]